MSTPRIKATVTLPALPLGRAELCRGDDPGPGLGRFRPTHTALDLARAPFVSRAQWVTPIFAAFPTFTREILSA